MDRIIKFQQHLKAHTVDELIKCEIENMQSFILGYLKENPIEIFQYLKEKLVVLDYTELKEIRAFFPHEHPLLNGLWKLVCSGYTLPGTIWHELQYERNSNCYKLLNTIEFNSELQKIVGINTNIYVSLAYCCDVDGEYYSGIDFEFQLKDDVDYQKGEHIIIDTLLDKKEELKKNQNKPIKNYELTAHDIEQINNILVDDKAFTENIYFVLGFCKLLGAFSKYSKIKWEYTYFRIPNASYFTCYTINPNVPLMPGIKLLYQSNNLMLTFDVDKDFDIPQHILDKCQTVLDLELERFNTEIIKYVLNNKDKIIDRCLHTLKCSKVYPKESSDFLVYEHDISSMGIYKFTDVITKELETLINQELGIEGFTLRANSEDSQYDDKILVLTGGTIIYVYANIPDALL